MLTTAHIPIKAPRASATRRSKDAGVKLRMNIISESFEQEMLAMKRMVAAYSAYASQISIGYPSTTLRCAHLHHVLEPGLRQHELMLPKSIRCRE